MSKVHQDIALPNLSVLVDETNLQILVPELLSRNVLSQRVINRILNPSHTLKRQKTDLYVEILKRGPEAFGKLINALESIHYRKMAEILSGMDCQDSCQIQGSGSSSLNSVDSNSEVDTESDGPCQSVRRKTSRTKRPDGFLDSLPTNVEQWDIHPHGNSKQGPSEAVDVNDIDKQRVRDPKNKVFNPPLYRIEIFNETLRAAGHLTPEDKIEYSFRKNQPVHVKCATQWQMEAVGKPQIYKMDSNPRGYALIVNNKEFEDRVMYPDRLGADNDEARLMKLLNQLHFVVESHQNKTKSEMQDIVKKFAQKPDLIYVDCVWITFMSHGQEGDSSEDSEVVGVDGIGYKTQEIVSCFYNDYCRALINKPKIFFFQACRGDLTDPGVLVGNVYLNFKERITTDGRRMNKVHQGVKIRTQSDIFVACPSPPGIMANRDCVTGAWFIQTVVDVFSEFACTTHLEDLLKMVDERIKGVNNLITINFQAVTTKTIGWNKHLYFNPGLSRDKATGATIHIGNSDATPESVAGMDVVDASSTNLEKSPNGVTYSRLSDEKDDDSDHVGKYDCFNITGCRTIYSNDSTHGRRGEGLTKANRIPWRS